MAKKEILHEETKKRIIELIDLIVKDGIADRLDDNDPLQNVRITEDSEDKSFTLGKQPKKEDNVDAKVNSSIEFYATQILYLRKSVIERG